MPGEVEARAPRCRRAGRRRRISRRLGAAASSALTTGATRVAMSTAGSASGVRTSRSRAGGRPGGRLAGSPPRHARPRGRSGPGRARPVGAARAGPRPPDGRAAGGVGRPKDLGGVAGDRDGADPGGAGASRTCTIIGRPWMSASGLPGRRVEAIRAGMRTIGFKAGPSRRRPYLCFNPGTSAGRPRVVVETWEHYCPPASSRDGRVARTRGLAMQSEFWHSTGLAARMSLEANKAFAAVLTAGIAFMVAGFVGEHRRAPAPPDAKRDPGRRGRSAAAAPAARRRCGRARRAAAGQCQRRERPHHRAAAMRGLPQLRRGRAQRRRAEPLRRGRRAARRTVDGFNYSAAMQGRADKPWDYEAMNEFINTPAARHARHAHGFRGAEPTRSSGRT